MTVESAVSANWRLLVPGPVEDVLLLPIVAERVAGAVSVARDRDALDAALRGPHRSVAAPDLTGWSRDVAGVPALDLLTALASTVQPGGWLCAGFTNRWYPARPASPGSCSPARVRRRLRAAGLTVLESYLPFPDQLRPAYLVPAHGAALSHFLREQFVPYVESDSALRGRARQHLLTLMRSVGSCTPDQVRSACAPASLIVARRTP